MALVHWTLLMSLVMAAQVVAFAFVLVSSVRPAVARLSGASWVRAAGERGRAGVSWLSLRVAAEALILTAGAGAVLVGAMMFTEILDGVTDGDDIAAIDEPAVGWLVEHRVPALNRVQIAITDLGGSLLLTLGVVVATVLVARSRKSWTPVWLSLTGLGGIQILVNVIKLLIGRQRPNPPAQLVTATGYSFPSGHSATSLVGFALIAWLLCMVTRSATAKATAWTAGAVGTVAVGLSRIYLGVHYPSDVLGGWTLGLTWLAVLGTAAIAWRYRIRARD
ncbi:phosphatase PAP2 family protein [Phytomonospora sp. NPDC050363]|uniref:phosphatase PAP2 family protein n=1 Tax=Phytomonospora sp. NPDC050363 TaxID=3155642 RepID=UPI0033D633BC